jgi:hypothetical protein
MRIQYKTTKHQREVSAECGRRLVKAGIASRVTKPRRVKAKPGGAQADAPSSGATYERRDITSGDE